MNTDDDSNTLHSWIEPELEARLTALVLGEASDFERDELERLIADRPELGLYRKRLEAVNRMLHQVAAGESGEEQGEWKLAPERRAAVLARLNGEGANEKNVVVMSGSRQRLRWGLVWRVAACAMTAAIVLGLMFPAATGSRRSQATKDTFAYYASDSGTGDSEARVRSDQGGFGGERELLRKEVDSENGFGFTTAAPAPQEPGISGKDIFITSRGGSVAIRENVPLLAAPADSGGQIDALNGTTALGMGGDLLVSTASEEGAKILVDPAAPSAPAKKPAAGGGGDWGKAPIVGRPVEESVDLGGEISAGYASDYVFHGKGQSAAEKPDTSLALENTNTYSGDTRISGGVVTLNQSSAPTIPSNPEPLRQISDEVTVGTTDMDRSGADLFAAVESEVKAKKAPVEGEVRDKALKERAQQGVDAKPMTDFSGTLGGSTSDLKSDSPAAAAPSAPAASGPAVAMDVTKGMAAPLNSIMADNRSPAELDRSDLAPVETPAPVPAVGEELTKVGAGTLSLNGGTTLDKKGNQPAGAQNQYVAGTEVRSGVLITSDGVIDENGSGTTALGRSSGAKPTGTVNFGDGVSQIDNLTGFFEVTESKMSPESAARFAQLQEEGGFEEEPRKSRLEVRAGTAQNTAELDISGPWKFGRKAEVEKSVQDIVALTPQIGQINIGGNDGTEDQVIRRELPFVAGEEQETNELRLSATPSANLRTSVYTVPPTFLSTSANVGNLGDPFAGPVQPDGGVLSGRVTAKQILESAGIAFPEGAAAIYNAETSQLIVRNTTDQTELLEAYIDGITASEEAPGTKSGTPAALAETSPEAEPFSTFSLHVSDVSFQLAKAALASGKWPEAEKIRIEEFVNAFDYGDPMPGMGERVAARIDQAAHPFLQQRNLVRIALRTAEAGRSSGTPLRLTLLLDSSGSMERPDRRETVRRAVATLAGLLGENDRITLVSFARQPRLVADAIAGNEAMKLAETVAALPSEGGTNLEAALQLAFEKAREHQDANAQNRIVLLTDGAANLGDAKAESLASLVEAMREAGIAFDAAGFGAEGLNDEILEALTRKGDGRYYLLDRPEDAEETFAKQIAGALRPAAKNVKVQVEFNPDRVKSYKLLGFEKHRLATEDFRNDAVDAAEMAAAEAGVAVYQVEPDPAGQGDLGSVSVRFRDLDSGEMIERRWALPHLTAAPTADQGGDAILLATVASQFAAKLAGGPLGDVVDLGELAELAAALPEGQRVNELRTMIEQARGLEGDR